VTQDGDAPAARDRVGHHEHAEAIAIILQSSPDLVRELALRSDWRAAVAALGLPERQARELRVEIVRRRAFGAGRRRPRGRR